jgi:hypothetical protein
MATKKRGAQPANKNALKHGFYSDHMLVSENNHLDAAIADDLASEINMLRIQTRRMFALAKGIKELDLAAEVLGALGLAATRLATLLKTQSFLTGGQDADVKSAISAALAAIVEEFKLK